MLPWCLCHKVKLPGILKFKEKNKYFVDKSMGNVGEMNSKASTSFSPLEILGVETAF